MYFNFYEVYDESGYLAKLNKKLKGKGVVSINQEIKELKLTPIHNKLIEMINSSNFENLISTDEKIDKATKVLSSNEIKNESDIFEKTIEENSNFSFDKEITFWNWMFYLNQYLI